MVRPSVEVPTSWRIVKGFAIFYFFTRLLACLIGRAVGEPWNDILAFAAVSALMLQRLKKVGVA